MLYKSFCVAGLVCLMMGCTQSTEDLGGKPNATLTDRDNDWFRTITISNMTEIQTSQMALSQSQNEAVKAFAQRMIQDHTAAEKKVSSLAEEESVTLPTKLDDKHQKLVEDLRSKTGPDFDRAFAKLQVDAHKETIDGDQDEANNGNNPQVKALAGELLGTLEHHLTMSENLENQVM